MDADPMGNALAVGHAQCAAKTLVLVDQLRGLPLRVMLRSPVERRV